MIKKALFVCLFGMLNVVIAQTPTDYLSADFHKERRQLLRDKMPKNSVTVVFANPVRNRANDVDFVFHQDPNFYYLTGYREPNAVLVMFSEDQTNEEGISYSEILYVQENNPVAEMWIGKRLGVEGAKNKLGFAVAKNAINFLSDKLNFNKFDKVYIEKFKDDYRNSTRNNAETYDLVANFKKNSSYNELKFEPKNVKYVRKMIANVPTKELEELAKRINRDFKRFPELKSDKLIVAYANANNNALRKELKEKIVLKINEKPKSNIDVTFLASKLAEMREVKTAEELKLLTKAIRISAVGQIEVMKAMKPHMSETEIQGIHEFVYKKYGAEYEGYPSIVGAGNNGCILHYTENNKTKVDNELVLMDLGAEYRGYTADVTRTIPANGKFSAEQKAIYEIVLKAQDEGIKVCTTKNMFWAPGEATKKVINKGLFDLGIIKSLDEKHNYFPHGTSHHIGLDVHDPGTYGKFQKNMVITVEPGIYIPKGSKCDKKWWGIAVRIEDDILITDTTPVNLSNEAPRTVKDIEKMMTKKSVLNDFVLPNLD